MFERLAFTWVLVVAVCVWVPSFGHTQSNEDGPKLLSEAKSLQAKARTKDDLQKASQLNEEALRIYNKAGDLRGAGPAYNSLANIYMRLGQYDKALELYEQSLAIWMKLEDLANESIVLRNMGHVHKSLRNPERAMGLYEKSLAINWKLGDAAGEALALGGMGNIHGLRGNYDRALELFQQSLAVNKKLGNVVEESYTLCSMAAVYRIRGNYEGALELYDNALAIKRNSGDLTSEGETLSSIGTVYAMRGNYDRALELYQQALSIAAKMGNVALEADTLLEMGLLYQAVREYDKALDAIVQALTIKNRIGVPNQFLRTCIGNLYLDQGNLKAAAPFVNGGGEVASLGRLALMRTDFSGALRHYGSLLRSQLKSRDANKLFAAHTGLGTTHERRGNDILAAEHFRQAIELTEEVRLSVNQAERETFFNVRVAGFSRTAPYEGLARILLRRKRALEAFRTSEFVKARVYAEAISRRGDAAGYKVPDAVRRQDELHNDQLAALSKNLQAAYAKENKGQIATLEQQVKEAKGRLTAHVEMLRREYPLFAATKYPQPMDLAQTALKDGEWALAFHVTDSGLLVYLTKGKELIKAEFKPIPRKELDDLVRKFRRPLELREDEDISDKLAAFDFATGKKLADVLLADVLPMIPTGALLIIVPDDSLGQVPFEMLVLNEGGRVAKDKGLSYVVGAEFFGDRNPISYYQSITALSLARTMTKQEDKCGDRVLVMADPVFEEQDDRFVAPARQKDQEKTRIQLAVLPDNLLSIKNVLGLTFPRLELTGNLARSLEQVFHQKTEVYEGMAACKYEFMNKDLSPFRFMVFATHGYVGHDLPGVMEPVLVLTLVDQPKGKDGFLRMSEVMGLNMNAEVVALTACQSGLGKQLIGEGTMGMGRAFQYAGARSALMSLWVVAETSSVMLVESFFKHMKVGKPKIEALKLARDDIRKAGYDHPFFWAPFILVGEVQ